MRQFTHATTIVFLMATLMGCGDVPSEEWISLFDGESLQDWRASENPGSFRVEDGVLICDGPRAHLFYEGEGAGQFKNFVLEGEVQTTPGSNSGLYFHTRFQEEGWPARGYEAQILNSNRPVPQGSYGERKMSGSLYGIRNSWKSPAQDGEWFRYRISVQGKTIRIWINDHLIVDYTEPADPYRPGGMEERRLDRGTFAIQCHDPESIVRFRNLRVKRLADNLASPGEPPADLELNRQVIDLSVQNFPIQDLHVHLKGGLTLEDALAQAREYGFTYGIAVNAGLQMTLPTEDSVYEYLAAYQPPPHTYSAMQAEGREWLDLFSPETVARFDYVFTDSMTVTDDAGRRMRLWIEEEVEVGDPQQFMEMLVNRTEKILNSEPIDIYVNPTYLPEEISDRYDELWTPERMDRVIAALLENDIALEINDARDLPSPAFIQRARSRGVKFTFGTNNAGAQDLGYLEYPLRMVRECSLEASDIWTP